MPENMITQSYVGQITVLGECFCYGAAIDDQQLVYLDIAGSATSVEAVWAKLAQAKECFIIPPQPNAPKIVLRSDKEKLKRFERKVEGVGIYHLLLVHRDFDPQYAELTRGYVFTTSFEQTMAKIGSHIQQLMDIAVFPIWHPYLFQAGFEAGLLRQIACFGAVRIQRIDLDKTAWERLICEALVDRQIQLP